MSLLKNLSSDDSIAGERDSTGGRAVMDSNIYLFKVQSAYVKAADSGALGLELSLKTAEGQELDTTLWMSSGTAKGGKNFYEKDGQKHYLPGFLMAESLCLLTVGKAIADMDTEKKVVKAYSPAARAEVPTQVDMLVDLLGKEIYGAVFKQTVDKTKKDDSGNYVATGETRDENELDKFFRAKDKMTVAEVRAQATEAAFFTTWQEKNAGKVRNRAKGAAAAGTAGAPKANGFGTPAAAAAATKRPANSLFS